MNTFLRSLVLGCVMLLGIPAAATASYRAELVSGAPIGIAGFIEGLFYDSTNASMELLPGGDPLYPFSEPTRPDNDGRVLYLFSPDHGILPALVTAVNARGIIEGLVIIVEENNNVITYSRIRVKGRFRGQSLIRATTPPLKDFLEEEDPSNISVSAQQSWNYRLAMAGRGRLDTDKDPSPDVMFEDIADLIDDDAWDFIPTIQPALLSAFRVNLSTSNRVALTLDGEYEPVGSEVASRVGNRNFQPTGQLDLVYKGVRLPRREVGLDLRDAIIVGVDLFYSPSLTTVTRDPASSNGRFAARTDMSLVALMGFEGDLDEIGELIGGNGSLQVTPVKLSGSSMTLGRTAFSGRHVVDRGVVLRYQRRGYNFAWASLIIEAYEDEDDDKPANFLDINDVLGLPLLIVSQSPQIRQRFQIRIPGGSSVPVEIF